MMFEACADLEGSFDQAEVWNCRFPKAAKEYECYECGAPIRKGEKHEHVFMIYDSRPSSYRTCLVCSRIWDRLFNGFHIHGGLDEFLQEAYGIGLTEVPDSTERQCYECDEEASIQDAGGAFWCEVCWLKDKRAWEADRAADYGTRAAGARR